MYIGTTYLRHDYFCLVISDSACTPSVVLSWILMAQHLVVMVTHIHSNTHWQSKPPAE